MVLKNLRDDIQTVLKHDPAARSALEVLLCYPGLHAVMFYRLAHWFWERRWVVVGRFVSHLGRMLTGIEIHPGARIGRRLFIDHGMGVVIGETAEIGDDVTLYQGVTLGGTSLRRGKRHPTLEDGVIVGAGAKVLGGFTVRHGARVGANAVVLSEVAAGASVVGIPAKPVGADAVVPFREDEFLPYGTPGDEIPDPVARALSGVLDEVQALRSRVVVLEAELAAAEHGAEALVGEAEPARQRRQG